MAFVFVVTLMITLVLVHFKFKLVLIGLTIFTVVMSAVWCLMFMVLLVVGPRFRDLLNCIDFLSC